MTSTMTRKTSTRAPVKTMRAPQSRVAKKPIRPATLKPAPAAPAALAATDTAPPAKKQKLVRDSFTIPKSEYAVLDLLKQRALRLSHPAKKSEILRAGISALNAMSDQAFSTVLDTVPSLKTGRPKKAKQPAPGKKSGKKAARRTAKKS